MRFDLTDEEWILKALARFSGVSWPDGISAVQLPIVSSPGTGAKHRC